MASIRFNTATDLAPLPFDEQVCRRASELKRLGLKWRPHVGCFVWDPDGIVTAPSPFPENIYFVLSLPRFVEIFGSTENMVQNLVWLPTWHQARMICRQLGVDDDSLAGQWGFEGLGSPGQDLLRLYGCIGEALQKQSYGGPFATDTGSPSRA